VRSTSRLSGYLPPPGCPISGVPGGSSSSAVPRLREKTGSSSRELRLPCRVTSFPCPLHPCSWVKVPSLGFSSLFAADAGVDEQDSQAPLPSVLDVRRPRRFVHLRLCRLLPAPTATSRVRSSGVFSPVKPYRLVDGRCPLVVSGDSLQGGCPPCARRRRPAYRASILTGTRCVSSSGWLLLAPDPLLSFQLLQVLLPSAWKTPSRPLPSWPSPQARQDVPAADLQGIDRRKDRLPSREGTDLLEFHGLPIPAPGKGALLDEAS
jgi:hypothetical protein